MTPQPTPNPGSKGQDSLQRQNEEQPRREGERPWTADQADLRHLNDEKDPEERRARQDQEARQQPGQKDTHGQANDDQSRSQSDVNVLDQRLVRDLQDGDAERADGKPAEGGPQKASTVE